MRLNNIYIHGIAYELSPISQEDRDALVPIMVDDETRRFLPQLCNLFDEVDGFSILLHSFEKYRDEGTGFLFGIRRDLDLLGFVAIMDIPNSPSIFYAMHPKYRRKGIMQACIKEVLGYLSQNNVCLSVQTYVYPDNYASISLLTNLGFSLAARNDEDMDVYKRILSQ